MSIAATGDSAITELADDSPIETVDSNDDWIDDLDAAAPAGVNPDSNSYDDVDSLAQTPEDVEPLTPDSDPQADSATADKEPEPEPESAEKPADDLSKEDQEIARALKKIGIKDARLKLDAARTEAQFLDATHPITQLLDKFKAKSDSRYQAMVDEAATRKIADPLRFSQWYHEQSPEQYADFINLQVENYPDFVADALRTKGFAVTPAGEQPPVTSEAQTAAATDLASIAGYEDVRSYYPEVVEAFEQKLAAAQTAAEAAKTAAEPAPAPAAAPEKTPEQVQIQEEQSKVFLTGFTEIQKSLEQSITTDLGINLDPKEWETAPALALAKQAVIDALLGGDARAGLVPFNTGLFEFAGERPEFKRADQNFRHFVDAREAENALKSAREIIPIAKSYLSERANLPHVKSLISAARDLQKFYSARARQKPVGDDYIPGRGNQGGAAGAQSKNSADWVDDL